MTGLVTRSRRAFSVGLVAVALVTSGCVATLSGTGGATCHVSTWTLSSQTIADAITSVLGDLTVTPDNDGMTLIMRADNTFTFSGDQTLGVSGATPWGNVNGTVDVDATVDGTYTAGAGTLTFTPTSSSGTAHFDGTVDGSAFSGSYSLAQAGLADIYGMSGTATSTCSATQLTLEFDDVTWTF